MTSDRARAASASSSSASIRSSQAGPMALAFPARIRSTIASPTRSSCMHPLYAPACVPSRGASRPRSAQTVSRPPLAADAMVAKEQTFGVVFRLDLRQALVVLAPELLLPIRLEIVGFVHVAPRA